MKIKVFDAANLARTLSQIDLEKAQDVADVLVDLFMELLPANKDYETALAALQKDAQGKSQKEIANLVSAKAFDKIANKLVEIKTTLTMDQIKGIGKHFKSLADIAALYNLKK